MLIGSQTQRHAQKHVYTYIHTQTHTHKPTHTHRNSYTQKPVYTDAFTQQLLHKRFYTQKLIHRNFYTQKVLQTGAFIHKHFYTQTLVHTDAFAHKSSVFDTRTSFRAKGLPPNQPNSPKTNSLWHSHLIFCERVAAGPTKLAKKKFLTIEPHSVLKGCSRSSKVAILPHSLTAPPAALREKRKKGERPWQRARGQEREREREREKMWRCEEKRKREREKMWRCEEKRKREREKEKEKRCMKMCRCEDVKMYSRPPLLEQPFAQMLSGIVIGFLKGLVPMNNV